MISSKALLDQTGISRATLNNYIRLGILPKPVVLSPSDDTDLAGGRLLGYFPDDAIAYVNAVHSLKSEGLSIAEIVEYLAENGLQPEGAQLQQEQAANASPSLTTSARKIQVSPPSGPSHQEELSVTDLTIVPNVSLGDHPHAAYVLNYNLELTWLNEAARKHIFRFNNPPAYGSERNVFQLLASAEASLTVEQRHQWANLHVHIVGLRLSQDALIKQIKLNDPALMAFAETINWQPNQDPSDPNPVFSEFEFQSSQSHTGGQIYRAYAVYFREGILIVHTPLSEVSHDLIRYLSGDNQNIHSLVGQQLPVLTPLAVLVADIQGSVRICFELPPNEYFELINQVWHAMSQVLKKYNGTHGKHAGDGVVYYFFPEPDSNYLFDILRCAEDMRAAMLKINFEWKLRKNWLNDLKLNIGLHEGQEWVGTFRSDHQVELVVLGDTINHAARLSDFARHGQIWATKSLISRLSAAEHKQIVFGIQRQSSESGDRFVQSSYDQIDFLVDLNSPKYVKLQDIAQLAVAEIRSVETT